MASLLNVIALISGGKDSLFSILHCQANGHIIVALTNLHPPPSASGNEDLDSYMYQTVGHSVIPLYEQALDIPLYRQEITGKAVNSSRDYEKLGEEEQDETEDLIPLLVRVLEAHPKANAVSTGAILSTYQRTRVESVALRLGLTPLSYLWQYPLLPPYTQSSLLYDMATVRQEAVIVKTASGGLDESFLGLNIADRRTIARVSKAMARFGEAGNGAIVGEGGEFETLALDGPSPLWKKKIKLINTSADVLKGGQAALKIKASTLEDKNEDIGGDVGVLRIPELLDDIFKRLLDAKDACTEQQSLVSTNGTPTEQPNLSSIPDPMLKPDNLPKNVYSDTPVVFTYSNLVSDTRTSSSDSHERQLAKILLRVDHVLKQWHLSKSRINHCTLLLRNMTDFTTLNPVYGQYFSDLNPPVRVTIAVGDILPKGIDVMLSIILNKDERDQKGKVTREINRQGLHVQGRSYWAPANIGPYSQAISVSLPPFLNHNDTDERDAGEIVYIAGQIPLIPASMQVYNDTGFKGQAVLSLQHLWRIGRTKGVKWWTAGVAFIPASGNPEEHVRVAQGVWKAIHAPPISSPTDDANEDEADVDPWDRLNSHSTPTFNDATYRSPIPDFSAVSSPTNPSTSPIPPCFVAQIHSLPRDVDIEWSATGLTSPSIHFSRNLTHSNVTITSPQNSRSRFYTLEICEERDVEVLGRLGENSVTEWTSATLYAGPGLEWPARTSLRGVQWIPCRRVWGENGREVQGVLVGRVDIESEEQRSRGGSEGLVGKLVSSLRGLGS
jgi:diphthine-ammonia ligase